MEDRVRGAGGTPTDPALQKGTGRAGKTEFGLLSAPSLWVRRIVRLASLPDARAQVVALLIRCKMADDFP